MSANLNAWTLSITFTIILAIFFLEAIFYGFVTFRDPEDLGYYLYLHQHMQSTFEGFCVSCRAVRVLLDALREVLEGFRVCFKRCGCHHPPDEEAGQNGGSTTQANPPYFVSKTFLHLDQVYSGYYRYSD